MKELSRKPRWRRTIYCSPACGFGCTRVQYELAVSRGERLARSLGEDWKPRIWENVGWRYCARRGGLEVHPAGSGYIAILGEPDSPGERWCEPGDTPENAIRKVVEVAKEEIAGLQAILEKAGVL
ncbi:MAG: hypothetical protein GY769_07855 [bacterium]|nr:hypothetical protein [bacterium]